MKEKIYNDYDFSSKILSEIFVDPIPVERTLKRFIKNCNASTTEVDQRIQDLLYRCGNINAVKEFLTYLVFETYLLENNDYSYQLSRLGFFHTLQESEVYTAMNKKEQKKLLRLMRWQFDRVTKMKNHICDLIDISSNTTVLDIGCGIGQLSYLLASEGMNVTAVDLNISPALEIQEILKSKIDYAGNVTFQKGDALDLSNINNMFDIVSLADVVEHITEKEKLFSEIDKKTVSGGLIALHTDNLTKLNILKLAKRLIYLLTFRNPKTYNLAWSGGDGGHVGLQTSQNIIDLLSNLSYSTTTVYDKSDISSKMAPKLFANGFLLLATKD